MSESVSKSQLLELPISDIKLLAKKIDIHFPTKENGDDILSKEQMVELLIGDCEGCKKKSDIKKNYTVEYRNVAGTLKGVKNNNKENCLPCQN